MKTTITKRQESKRRTEAKNAAGWSRLEPAAQRREVEAREHDKMVSTLTPATVLAAARDLGQRGNWDYRDPDQRWCLGRLAALARRIGQDPRLQDARLKTR